MRVHIDGGHRPELPLEDRANVCLARHELGGIGELGDGGGGDVGALGGDHLVIDLHVVVTSSRAEIG
jgi:hypothetical protein